MPFTPIIGTLAYLWDLKSDEVLMIRRNARPSDDHFGKLNGLGGKVEKNESILSSLRREIQEEAALKLTSFRLRGTITWTNFGPHKQEWLGFLFLADGWTGNAPTTNNEGTLEWIPRARLLQACSADPHERDAAEVPMWAGDRHFVPLVFDDDPRAFHGTMPYEAEEPLSWTFERL